MEKERKGYFLKSFLKNNFVAYIGPALLFADIINKTILAFKLTYRADKNKQW